LAAVRLSRTLEVMLLQGVTRQKKPQRAASGTSCPAYIEPPAYSRMSKQRAPETETAAPGKAPP